MKQLVEVLISHSPPKFQEQISRIPDINRTPDRLGSGISTPSPSGVEVLQRTGGTSETFLRNKIAAELKRRGGHVEELDGILAGVFVDRCHLDILQEVGHFQEVVLLRELSGLVGRGVVSVTSFYLESVLFWQLFVEIRVCFVQEVSGFTL